jgi:hypothetical protein
MMRGVVCPTDLMQSSCCSWYTCQYYISNRRGENGGTLGPRYCLGPSTRLLFFFIKYIWSSLYCCYMSMIINRWADTFFFKKKRKILSSQAIFRIIWVCE